MTPVSSCFLLRSFLAISDTRCRIFENGVTRVKKFQYQVFIISPVAFFIRSMEAHSGKSIDEIKMIVVVKEALTGLCMVLIKPR